MTYLNTNARTVSTTQNEKFQPMGRTSTLFGVFAGYVKRADDVQKMGRLQVWIPEFGSAPDEEAGWITVSYCSPFAGATNVNTTSKSDIKSFDETQTSYGMWMVPPDIDNQVLIMFINGDAARGIWFGSMFGQFANNMIPGMAADTNTYQYPGQPVPAAEYNKWDKRVTQPDSATKPFEETKFKGLGNQGLITDQSRGITNSSARRESPSNVFGILTPGPVIDKNVSPDKVRRKGGSSFIMDDGDGTEYVQLTTKSGAQIKIDETNGFVYLINRDGTAWVQMDQYGDIDIFGARNISMRAQRDINLRADRNINIEAGQDVFIKAAKDTAQSVTNFTYDVNNIPRKETIPVWSYVGEGKGTGGSIVLQSLNNLQSTSQKGAFITTIDDDVNIKAGNAFNLQTITGGQNFSSKLGIKLTTNGALDLAATGNIRVGSNDTISVVGTQGVVVCSETSVDITTHLNALTVSSNTIAHDGEKLDGGYQGTKSAEVPMSAAPANPAAIKPMIDKINILATWSDPDSKFKRNSQTLQTTITRFPTYEPCPEHENFKSNSITTSAPLLTPDDKTYQGSSGAGNNVATPPAASVNPAADSPLNTATTLSDSDVVKGIDTVALRHQLIIHEGLVKKSYIDTTGLLHGGIGHLMRTNEIPIYPLGTPITDAQIETWYTQDSTSAIKISQELIGTVWSDLSDIRKRAVIDLAYNLGKARLARFTKFIAAMKMKDYNTAGKELRDSKWFSQVGRRGTNVITMIVNNIDLTASRKI